VLEGALGVIEDGQQPLRQRGRRVLDGLQLLLPRSLLVVLEVGRQPEVPRLRLTQLLGQLIRALVSLLGLLGLLRLLCPLILYLGAILRLRLVRHFVLFVVGVSLGCHGSLD
jgi:hypothetical protein